MSTHATGTFEGKSWDEKPYSEIDGGGKLSLASIRNVFTGGIEGEGTLEYLLIYREDGTGTYFGAERVVGRIGERSGSFVLQHSGTFEAHGVEGTWFVVPGCGTGDLRGLRGAGGYRAAGGPQGQFTLDYDFA